MTKEDFVERWVKRIKFWDVLELKEDMEQELDAVIRHYNKQYYKHNHVDLKGYNYD